MGESGRGAGGCKGASKKVEDGCRGVCMGRWGHWCIPEHKGHCAYESSLGEGGLCKGTVPPTPPQPPLAFSTPPQPLLGVPAALPAAISAR